MNSVPKEGDREGITLPGDSAKAEYVRVVSQEENILSFR